MINNLEAFLTYENIYLIANWGVLPFWIMLITVPNNILTKILVHSVVVPILLSSAYIFIIYKIYLNGDFFGAFDLYMGLENLYAVFSDESFLLVFWLHFLSISLFVGSWISRDSQKYFISRFLTIISLIITYFLGPVGLVFYWLIRIFFAKKIGFND